MNNQTSVQQATVCFLVKDKQVLLAMKKRGFGVGKYNGVGGKKHPGETIEQTAIRETFEEIGVTPKNLNHVATINFSFPHKPEWGQQVFVYLSDSWVGEPAESEEMAPQWFAFDKIPYDQMWVDDQYWLPQVLAGTKLTADFALNEDNTILDSKIVENNKEIFKDRNGRIVYKPDNKTVKPRLSSYGLYIKDNKILMVMPTWAIDKWELPGGGAEADESLTNTLHREFREETRYEISDFTSKPFIQIKQNFYSDDTDEYFYSEMSFFMITQATENKANAVDMAEIKAIEWVSLASLSPQNCKDYILQVIQQAVK